MEFYDLIFALVLIYLVTTLTIKSFVEDTLGKGFFMLAVHVTVVTMLASLFDNRIHETIIVGTLLASIYVTRKYYVKGVI